MRTEQELCSYPVNTSYIRVYRFPIPYEVGGVILLRTRMRRSVASTLEAWLKNMHCGYKVTSVALFAGFYLNV